MSTLHRKEVISLVKVDRNIPISLRWKPQASYYLARHSSTTRDVKRLLIHLDGSLVSWDLHVQARDHNQSIDHFLTSIIFLYFGVDSNILEACCKIELYLLYWWLVFLFFTLMKCELSLYSIFGVNETCLTRSNTFIREYF